MSLKKLFLKLEKRKPDEPMPLREAPPVDAVEYKPVKIPADAPTCETVLKIV